MVGVEINMVVRACAMQHVQTRSVTCGCFTKSTAMSALRNGQKFGTRNCESLLDQNWFRATKIGSHTGLKGGEYAKSISIKASMVACMVMAEASMSMRMAAP